MAKPQKLSLWQTFKKQFLTGLIVLLPLVITIFIIGFLLSTINKLFGGRLAGIGWLVLIILIWLVGVISYSALGRNFIRHVKRLFMGAPVFGGMFKGIEEVTDKVFAGDKGAFRHVVLVEYPKKDSYALGFISSGDELKFKKKRIIPVFVPTTPNPTSGLLLFFPKDKLTLLDIPVQKGMETIISMGFLHPKEYKRKGKI